MFVGLIISPIIIIHNNSLTQPCVEGVLKCDVLKILHPLDIKIFYNL